MKKYLLMVVGDHFFSFEEVELMILEVMGDLLFPLALVDPLYPSAWFKVAFQSVA